MSIIVNKCHTNQGIEIPGLLEILPVVREDSRGYFFESYNQRDFEAAGIKATFVQDNQSSSKKGVLRGLHYQINKPQGKLVRSISGAIYDVAVDLRPESPTYLKYCGLILDGEKQNMLYIPEGFAHGFYVLSDYAVTSYKCTDFYSPENERGIMWNDPQLSIDWECVLKGAIPVLSEKDQNYGALINKEIL